jgi:nucleoid-associated protein YgaU
MSLKEKYADLLKLGEELKVKDGDVYEKDGKLVVKGTTEYQMAKDILWDKIKTYEGYKDDLIADIRVEKTDVYGYHTVVSGDTLSKIAKNCLGDAMAYPKIFEANRDILDNPDMIKVGQTLKIPNRG